MYRGRLWTMRQYAGFGSAQESNQRYRYLLAQGVTGLSVAFDLPTQMGYDSDHALAAGEVGRVGVAIDSIEDMAELFDGIPLDRVSTSMTINATAIILLALYLAVARRQGRAPAAASRHDSERHPEGIRRARHLHLPAAAVAADRDGHLRVLRARAAELEHDLDQRLPHPRGGLDGGPGGRVHVRERDRLRAGGGRRRARRQQLRPAALVLLQRAQRLPRGGREVPRRAAAVGADHARPVRRDEPARAAAALPHADGRQHADRAAARQQHRPRRAAGAGGGAGRHAVAALQRPRRGAGAADRGVGAHRAADAAGHRRRERRGQHRRSVRRRVRDRGADRPDRDGGARRCSIGSTRPAARWRPSSTGSIQREIQDSAYRAQQAIDAGERVVVGVNRYTTDDAAGIDVLQDRSRRSSARQVERVRAVRASRDAAPLAGGARRRSWPPRAADRQPRAADRRGRRGARDRRRDLRRAARRSSASTRRSMSNRSGLGTRDSGFGESSRHESRAPSPGSRPVVSGRTPDHRLRHRRAVRAGGDRRQLRRRRRARRCAWSASPAAASR